MKIVLSHGQAYVEKIPGGGWYLVSIKVEEQYRGSGIGTRMMNKILKKCGRPIFLLSTDELGGDPIRLKEFYKKFGFTTYKQNRNDGLPYNANLVLYS